MTAPVERRRGLTAPSSLILYFCRFRRRQAAAELQYVTEDGAETDLKPGHYERFIDEDLNKYSNLTTGKVYWNVPNKERRGEYLGSTVQVIPHVTDESKRFVYRVGKTTDADVIITEIGGVSPGGALVETVELRDNPFLWACSSTPNSKAARTGPIRCFWGSPGRLSSY